MGCTKTGLSGDQAGGLENLNDVVFEGGTVVGRCGRSGLVSGTF